jgi:DNA-binding response OmpR family regulator
MNILVVDDDLATLRVIGSMLRTSGSAVDMAPSADMAIRMMEKTTYDVLFVDYNMPTHNGVWFIRNAAIPPQSRVILLSGSLDPVAVSDFRRLGIQSVIKKPFTMVSVLGCLKGIEDAASNIPGIAPQCAA